MSIFDGDTIQLTLQKAINMLPDKQQQVFKMKYFEDLTYEELSNILDTSIGALKKFISYCNKKNNTLY